MTDGKGDFPGEIVRGNTIGRNPKLNYSWATCADCGPGSERWVQTGPLLSKSTRPCKLHSRRHLVNAPPLNRSVQA